jgi:type II secretory pathway component PulF
MALRLTMETAMPIGRALGLSLRATGNSAFAGLVPAVKSGVRKGEDLTRVLGDTGLFPELFMSSLSVGEESGRIPEVLRHLGDQYHDEAGRRLAALAALAGYGIWLMVAILIVVAIMRIAMSYISLLG